jgi:hypothetical protein
MKWCRVNFEQLAVRTLQLSMLEQGAFNALLACHVLSEGLVPRGFRGIERACRAQTPEERAAARKVASKLFPVIAGTRKCPLIDRELSFEFERLERKRRGGKRRTELAARAEDGRLLAGEIQDDNQ